MNRSLFHTPRPPVTTDEQEVAELMSLGVNHPARRHYREREVRARNQARENSWNGTPLRYTPANLRGIKCATKEPWHIDQVFYEKKTGSFEEGMNDDEAFDDTSVLAASKGYVSKVTATGLTGFSQPTWDSSPFRHIPHALKGIKAETREPWAFDQAINRDMALEGFSVCARSSGLDTHAALRRLSCLWNAPSDVLVASILAFAVSAKVENDSVAGNRNWK